LVTYYCSRLIVLSLDDSDILKGVIHAYDGDKINAKFVATMRGWSPQQLADFGKRTRKIRAAIEEDKEFEHANLKKIKKPGNYQQIRQELMRDDLEKHQSNKSIPTSQQVLQK
jgi:hypothetical protein